MTKHERTGWRDSWPSLHHRQFGMYFPMCDVDALLHHRKKPVALVELKHRKAADAWKPDGHNIAAQRELANGYRDESRGITDGLPFFVCAYSPEDLFFLVWALNAPAERALRAVEGMDGVDKLGQDMERGGLLFRPMMEPGWVRLEGVVRGLTALQVEHGLKTLRAAKPPTLVPYGPDAPPRLYNEHARYQRNAKFPVLVTASAHITARGTASASGESTSTPL